VFVEAVTKEDTLLSAQEGSARGGDLALDALFGGEEKGNSTKVPAGGSEISALYSPDYNPIITEGHVTRPAFSPGPAASAGFLSPVDGVSDALESPAERIALTPKSKVPPGSGMRKVNACATLLGASFGNLSLCELGVL
jgi:hypothetical protein